MANTTLVAAGVAMLVVGGAIAGYGTTKSSPSGSTGPTPEATAAMTSAVDQLKNDIKNALSDVQSVARKTAGMNGVQAALSTDQASLDFGYTSLALKFALDPGEVVEIGILPVTDAAKPAFLLQPENATRPKHAGEPGSYIELMGDKVRVTDVLIVTPLDHKDIQFGYVTVSKQLDLTPALHTLDEAHVAGTLEISGETRTVGIPAPGATQKTMELSATPPARLVVAIPPLATAASPTPYFAGGGGLAGVGAILLVVGLVTTKRKPAEAPVPRADVTPAQFSVAQTQLANTATAIAPTTAAFGDAGRSATSASLEAGATIGRWEIIKRLGSGGMADVFLAHARGEAGFAKQVAIKVMHPHLARNERAVEHFLDEARLASRISHPNVVQIQDLGKIGEDYVIVMDYVDGVDLERLLASARATHQSVPIDVGLGILARICDGLDAAHRATTADGKPMNLVHRDVKAANVLVSRQGTIKIVDFGIAKAASQSHLTVAGETKGTPSMMAPEQRVGDVVDVRADVYSVAAVAYEILTGQTVNLDLAALAHLGIENWPHLPPPTSQRAQLPAELDGLILSALAFDRERRPASCAALGASFEAVMKRHSLAATDKDIARWVGAELDRLAA